MIHEQTKDYVLGMYVPELSLQDICEELTDIRRDIATIESYIAGEITASEFRQDCSFEVSDLAKLKEAQQLLGEEKNRRVK